MDLVPNDIRTGPKGCSVIFVSLGSGTLDLTFLTLRGWRARSKVGAAQGVVKIPLSASIQSTQTKLQKMKRALAFLLTTLTALACGSSTTPDPSSDASTPSSDATTPSKPPLDPSCEDFGGCQVWSCACTNVQGAMRSGNGAGGCLTAEATCKRLCDGYEQPFKTPISCVKKVAETPQVDAATPEEGRPGGACRKVGEPCSVSMCECNDGSKPFPNSAPCKNGICGGQSDACPAACARNGGWSGRGQD